jgi:hypothetical protein
MTEILEMVDVSTHDLSSGALDWALAIVEEGKVLIYPEGGFYPLEGSISLNEDDMSLWLNLGGRESTGWYPSISWDQAGPLILKHLEGEVLTVGEDMLGLAMRAIVAKVLGKTVRIPLRMLAVEADQ